MWRAEDESLSDRIYALKDMLSPTTRKRIVSTWNATTSYGFWGGKLLGNAVWVVTTSALLVGLPLALAIENETMMVQQEKEMLAQQQGAQQVSGVVWMGRDGPRGGCVLLGGHEMASWSILPPSLALEGWVGKRAVNRNC